MGWRISFVFVAFFAILASFLALSVMPDVTSPKMTDEEKAQPVFEMMGEEIKTMCKFMRYPTFVLMIFPGIFGSVGGYFGGVVSDFLVSKIGCRGRPATA